MGWNVNEREGLSRKDVGGYYEMMYAGKKVRIKN